MLTDRPNPTRSLLLSFTLLCLCFLILLYHHHTAGFDSHVVAVNPAGDSTGSQVAAVVPTTKEQEQQQQRPPPLQEPPPDVEIVAASLNSDDTSWFQRHLQQEWSKRIYVVDADDDAAPLTVPKNKGREAMVYLTHIVDHYDSLAPTTIFFHAARFAWHNDDPDYDAVPTLRRLSIRPHPAGGIHPHLDAAEEAEAEGAGPTTTKAIYKRAFEGLLPGVPVPDVVAVSCCSQFAVTRETIRRRPREDYVRFRDWLLDTPLTDDLSGRVMEFAWNTYTVPRRRNATAISGGLCGGGMRCTEGACEGRYTLPGIATLPDHWPLLGWQGEDRNFTGPLD
ncbi:hypothetical protein PG994_002223 [Apiospora phragmitis]|uniref:Uncharacterized protein n=1 Tax=Apiospora phragmitis TaxID=2905665 RepID=A0ABR1WVQ7_9PEZI